MFVMQEWLRILLGVAVQHNRLLTRATVAPDGLQALLWWLLLLLLSLLLLLLWHRILTGRSISCTSRS